ncbi:MAG: cysteine desulfurase [Propionibacteriaceae bacterium]|jgi:cysteine desulfurase|nr:cysteine desulfurase [Propionibacteriaceae bacterium]
MAAAYLDHASSSPLRPVAAAAMAAIWELPGNPSSAHAFGRNARKLLEDARESIADDIGAHPTQIVLCAGGTQADNMVLRGVREAYPNAVIAISAVEHPAVLEAKKWPNVEILGVDETGRLLAEDLTVLDSRCKLISSIWVNNETGVISPIESVVARAAELGALAHSDGVQALGRVPIDFSASGLDFLSLSAHKVGGPVGVGALVVRRSVKLPRIDFGGGQEAGLRSGTVPAALAVGFAAALHAAIAEQNELNTRMRRWHSQLADFAAEFPGARLNCAGACTCAIVNITFSHTRAEDILLLLDQRGIAVSTGSACATGVHQASEVLLAMGRSLPDAGAAIRISFGWSTTEDEVNRLLAVLPEVLASARGSW